MVRTLDGQELLSLHSRRTRTLYHRDPAAECDWRASHGPHDEQHDPGHLDPPRPYARQERLLGAWHRPRQHRHRGQGGEQIGATRHQEDRPQPRGVPQARLGLDPRARWHHPQAVAPPRLLLRLGTHLVHHGRHPLEERHPRLRRPLQQRPDLPRCAHGQLGPESLDGLERRRSHLQGRAQQAVLSPLLSPRGRRYGSHRRRGRNHPHG